MTTRSSRYRFVLVDEGAELPVLYRHRPSTPPVPGPSRALASLVALMDAFAQLRRRGPGASGWAMPLTDNPLSFLLDAMSDAVLVREPGGKVIHRNRAALALPVLDRPPVAVERIHIGQRYYERRCLCVDEQPYGLVIEVLSALHQEDRG